MPRPAEAAVGWHRRSFPRVVLAVVLSCALATLGPAAPAGADEDLGWVNGTRGHNGLSVLAEDSGLDEVARRHTETMIGQGSLFHSSNLAGAIEPIHPDWQRIGENVGVGPSSADIDAAFLKSPEHRVNILGAYNLAGTATAVGPDGRVWITEEFVQVPGGHPPGGPAAGPAPERGSPLPAPSSPAAGAGSAALPSRSAEGGTVAKRRPAATAAAASPDGEGYWVVGHDGGVLSFGDASFAGSLGGRTLNAPVTAVMPAPDVGGDRTARRPETDGQRSRPGYWLVGADGGVFSFGGARFAGSLAGIPLNAPTVAAAASPDGHGYWLVDARGGVFSLGSATFMGSTGGLSLNAPITAITPTPDGRGYWLVGADGGVFAFGDAPFAGSLADRSLRSPVTAAASTPDGRGYWLVDADGGVFSFGDAPFAGSLAGKALNAPITAAAANPNGRGYWLVGADGGVFSLGQATFMGSGQQTGQMR
jgi:hypothetical protein